MIKAERKQFKYGESELFLGSLEEGSGRWEKAEWRRPFRDKTSTILDYQSDELKLYERAEGGNEVHKT